MFETFLFGPNAKNKLNERQKLRMLTLLVLELSLGGAQRGRVRASIHVEYS